MTRNEILKASKPFTMTSYPRMECFYDCIVEAVKTDIPGAIVECGVWKGGNAMIAGYLMKELGADRDIFLYDTFTGMTEPGEHDIKYDGKKAVDVYHKNWHRVSDKTVTNNIMETQYDGFHIIVGDIMETIPEVMPESVSVIRLDTDWFESTLHELKHFWDIISPGGFLIIDDFNCWKGSQKACKDFFGDKLKYTDIDNQSVLIKKETT